jgi:hypothetical protein
VIAGLPGTPESPAVMFRGDRRDLVEIAYRAEPRALEAFRCGRAHDGGQALSAIARSLSRIRSMGIRPDGFPEKISSSEMGLLS